MFVEICADETGRRYVGTLYQPGCIAALPWGDARFDCAVLLCDPDRAKRQIVALGAELVRANLDWVQVAGIGSEAAHDAIDAASIACGRQAAVGDGSPMTSWHDEARSIRHMADEVFLCGQDWVLILVIGNEADLHAAATALRGRVEHVVD